MIKIGLIGCGQVAESYHMLCYQNMKNVRVTAVCDVDVEKTKKFISKYNIPNGYTDFEELFEKEDLDIVDICTPGYTHYQLTDLVIDQGLNVLVEKPIALSLNETIDLYNKSKKKDVKVCVVQNYRFRPNVLETIKACKEGKIGGIREIVSTNHNLSIFSLPRWQWNEKKSQSFLYELAIHQIDAQTFFCGEHEKIIGIYKRYDEKLNYTTDLYAIIEYKKGSIGVLDLSAFSSSTFARLDIYGTAADAHLKFFPDYFYLSAGGMVPYTEFMSELKRTLKFTKSALFEMKKYRMGYHLRLISDFIEAVRNNSDPPVSIESVLNTMKLLEALKTSRSGDNHNNIDGEME